MGMIFLNLSDYEKDSAIAINTDFIVSVNELDNVTQIVTDAGVYDVKESMIEVLGMIKSEQAH
jgi:hypothetical protein